MSEQSLEKADHELDIQRADCRSKFWQQAQAEEQAASEKYWHEWDRIQSANLRRMLNLPPVPERNEHVAQPLAAILNQFDA